MAIIAAVSTFTAFSTYSSFVGGKLPSKLRI